MKTIGKEKLKIYKSLKLKKYRLKYNKFLVEGSKMINEIPSDQRDRIDQVLISEDKFLSELPPFLKRITNVITDREMKALSSMKNPPGILAVIQNCALQDLTAEDTLSGRTIGLEAIGDPGNLGTIVRSAAWFGIKRILLIGECVDPFNSKVIQASMGSFWNVFFYRAQLSELNSNCGIILTADMDGMDYRQYDWPEDFCLILGSESHGVSAELKDLAGQSLSIPRTQDTVTDSLNLSVTASILMAASSP